jgi:hypothetical protein
VHNKKIKGSALAIRDMQITGQNNGTLTSPVIFLWSDCSYSESSPYLTSALGNFQLHMLHYLFEAKTFWILVRLVVQPVSVVAAGNDGWKSA